MNYGTDEEDSRKFDSYKDEINKLSNMVKDLSGVGHSESNDKRLGPTTEGINYIFYSIGKTENRGRLEIIEPFLTYRNSYFSNPQNQDLLTNRVWPKARILLAIASNMYKEKAINLDQRGKLKDLILDSDPRLHAALNQYYVDGNRNLLYRNLVSLTFGDTHGRIVRE